jgi:hypothetical protein
MADTNYNTFRQHPELKRLLRDALESAAREFFRDFAGEPMPANFIEILQYEQDFGSYVLSQNPYADIANLSLPTIPTELDTERRWVRKSGVLRDHTAVDPLDGALPIPAGQVVPFTSEDWEGLRETDSTMDPGPGSKTNPDGLPPNHTVIYNHRVVKLLRFRYTVNERRKEGDRQASYLLCLFSGGDY